MPAPPAHDVTQLLVAWCEGDRAAVDRLVPLVYSELRRMAHRRMRDERPDHVLQTTALINEAYLRLVDITRVRWQNRAHFFAISARVMRRILVDAARERGARKRGGQISHVIFDEALMPAPERDTDLVALDAALEELAEVDPRKSQVVELRYFGGLSVDETAEVLSVSVETVARDWRLAKLWLLRELGETTERNDSTPAVNVRGGDDAP
jgi:RNA polymerase sigma-70 factor (ECF subfamily)